jgi:phosphoribosylformylglycinamidine synthase
VIRIPPTLLVSALTLIDDVTSAVTMDAKAAGNLIVLVGTTRDELGGSRLLRHLGRDAADPGVVPRVDLPAARAVHEAVARALASGAVRSCHDLCEGGLAVALAEMCLAGGLGATLNVGSVPRTEGLEDDAIVLFSESAPRYLLETTWADVDRLGSALGAVPHAIVATLVAKPTFVATGVRPEPLLDLKLADLVRAFRTGLGI